MQVLQTILTAGKAKTIAPSSPSARELSRLLGDIGDIDMPASLLAANEVQSIAKYGGTVTGGTFKLTIILANGKSFTTAAIAYNANAATIQTAIDTAATAAAIPGWVNGSIVVAGGDLTIAAVTLSCSGAAVAGQKMGLTTIDGTSLVGGTAGAVTVTVDGQTDRMAWAVLQRFGIISGTVPVQGTSPSGITAVYKRGFFPFGISDSLVQDLIVEAAVEDNSVAVQTTLKSLIGF